MEDRRKNVRLRGHDYRQAGAYFVTVCSRDRADLFGKIVGGDVLIAPKVNLSSIGAVIQNTLEQIPSITKYVIMPNHIHFIVVFEGNGSMSTSTPTESPSTPTASPLAQAQGQAQCGASRGTGIFHF